MVKMMNNPCKTLNLLILTQKLASHKIAKKIKNPKIKKVKRNPM